MWNKHQFKIHEKLKNLNTKVKTIFHYTIFVGNLEFSMEKLP